MNTQDTICAIATAQGGAIGVIRISGKDAIAITDRIFTPVGKHPLPLSERKAYTMAFGHIRQDDGEIIDEVLIGLFKSPHSYTGEDCVEISCHGSSFILQQVMQLLIPKRKDGFESGGGRGRPNSLFVRSHPPDGYEPDEGRFQPRTVRLARTPAPPHFFDGTGIGFQ